MFIQFLILHETCEKNTNKVLYCIVKLGLTQSFLYQEFDIHGSMSFLFVGFTVCILALVTLIALRIVARAPLKLTGTLFFYTVYILLHQFHQPEYRITHIALKKLMFIPYDRVVRLAQWSLVAPSASTTRDQFLGSARGLRFVDLNLTPRVFLRVLFSSLCKFDYHSRSEQSSN